MERTFVDHADVRPCRYCDVEVYRIKDADGWTHDLDPAVVIDGSTVTQGWYVADGPRWAVHVGSVSPGRRFVFRSHRPCLPTSSRRGPRMTQQDPFGKAAAPGASGPSMQDLEGRLLYIDVTTIERGIQTSAGTSDAVKCDLVDLDGGEQHPNAALWGKVIVNQLAPGTKYVGRIAKGVAVGPNNPPWTWVDGDENDRATAVKYLTWAAGQSVNTKASPAPTPAATPTTAPSAAPWV